MPRHLSNGEDRDGEKGAGRRSHRKSRNGCGNCKRRRVKCDETKPACTNCVRFEVHCDFTPPSPSTESGNSATSHAPETKRDSAHPGRRRRGRPRKFLNTVSSTSAKSAPANSPSTHYRSLADAFDASIPQHVLNVADMELLYEWITVTSATLVYSPPQYVYWRENVVQIGLSYPFVLRFCFAMTAQHLMRLRPERRGYYLTQAESHFAAGLRDTAKVVPHLNMDNCQALYVASSMVCYNTFAKGPPPGDYLVFSDHGPAMWLPLLKGIRSITDTIGLEILFSGLLEPMARREPFTTEPLATVEGFPRMDWEKPIDTLRRFIVASKDPNSDIYLRALDDLYPYYKAVHGQVDGFYLGDTIFQIVLIWLYFLAEEMVLSLEQKEPLAILVMAHFVPLMKTMEKHWHMDGWMEHIMYGCHKFLEKGYHSWLRWPMEQVGMDEAVVKRKQIEEEREQSQEGSDCYVFGAQEI